MSNNRIATQATCRHCGAAFRPRRLTKGLYCSRKCWWAAEATRRPTIRCKCCGKAFRLAPNDIKGGIRCCSRKCNLVMRKVRAGRIAAESRFWALALDWFAYKGPAKPVQSAKCKQCGVEFLPHPKAKGLFCSKPCWRLYESLNQATATCRYCGNPYNAKPCLVAAGRTNYCSQPCSFADRRRIALERFAERFWSKVNKTDGCWLWTAKCDHFGYGRIIAPNAKGDYVPQLAHRVAYEFVNGPIPNGLQVLHNCPGGDVPACVNPAHMFLGTQLDNMLDCSAKGRTTRGERSGTAKLTEEHVAEIRRRFEAGGTTYSRLAREYGVSIGTISGIINRRSWTHI
jgi:hypothetical protein